ncbi:MULTISPECIES: glycosyltransferase family 2 protein [unclassified Rathayibacter]|uniref:glycosyltransferase family 2 protein n=1 Tax=unclassified Rathayibacter TaxID=2609250 RepID=UPI0006F9B968|nr:MULTISPECIES: glycosyltransferase family 2 protein [unclassified Rathayibacter]KQQ00917.1 hypothetical protein ASF42_16570 [Rathayibacter sp. Leaf294]KQS10320.1 hypothetical protein ASG06_16570 [Rathayibacter sp. Leaf185]
MTTVAAIITFEPDLERLTTNLEAVAPQVDGIVVVDNASAGQAAVRTLLESRPDVHLIVRLENGGIASALNSAFAWAEERGAAEVVVLDQDSVCAPGMVARLRAHSGRSTAIVAPAIHDRNLGSAESTSDEAVDVDYCITSGGLYTVAAWRDVAGYDESFFIDFVDFDYCLRLRVAGYRIRRVPTAVLLHEIGHGQRHGSAVAYHHSAFRSRHMARDMVFYARKHSGSPKELRVGGRGLVLTLAVLLRKALIVARHEDDRSKKILALIRGSIEGLLLPVSAQLKASAVRRN